jgi:hypothetical protein
VKNIFKHEWLGYALGFVGVGLLIVAALALIGPATGNVFSNIYSNAPSDPYPASNSANSSLQQNPYAQAAAGNASPSATAVSQLADTGVRVSPYRTDRLIIKNAELNLLAEDIDRAAAQITNIAVTSGGYVIGERMWMQDGLKFAAITIGVPSDQFEVVQRQVRAVGAQVLNATSSGQDVSDEYVDLEARQRNLEATAARIREFLGQATDAEQALQVNAKLSEVEAEIEQIKGRRAYLQDRSAYSTMTINLEPRRPTPAPSPIATPVGWQPEKTFTAASDALTSVLHSLGDVAIWLAVFVAPLAIPLGLAMAVVWWIRRKRAKNVMRGFSQGVDSH